MNDDASSVPYGTRLVAETQTSPAALSIADTSEGVHMPILHSILAALTVALLTLMPDAPAQADTRVALVSSLAGSARVSGRADGVGPAARFSDPSGVALSADGLLAL